jgi:hypothetical protein
MYTDISLLKVHKRYNSATLADWVFRHECRINHIYFMVQMNDAKSLERDT